MIACIQLYFRTRNKSICITDRKILRSGIPVINSQTGKWYFIHFFGDDKGGDLVLSTDGITVNFYGECNKVGLLVSWK